VTRPTRSPAWTSRGSRSAGASAQARPSAHQPPVDWSSQPVRDASEASATSSPPRPRTIHSSTLSQRRPRAADGSLRRSQRYLNTVGSDPRGRPVWRLNQSAPRSAASAAASSVPRGSNHEIPGTTGRPAGSSNAPVSAIPVTPTATIGPSGAARIAAAATSRVVARTAAGSISCPVATRNHGVRFRAWAISRPSGPTTTALQNVVPTSIPSSSGSVTCVLSTPGEPVRWTASPVSPGANRPGSCGDRVIGFQAAAVAACRR